MLRRIASLGAQIIRGAAGGIFLLRRLGGLPSGLAAGCIFRGIRRLFAGNPLAFWLFFDRCFRTSLAGLLAFTGRQGSFRRVQPASLRLGCGGGRLLLGASLQDGGYAFCPVSGGICPLHTGRFLRNAHG